MNVVTLRPWRMALVVMAATGFACGSDDNNSATPGGTAGTAGTNAGGAGTAGSGGSSTGTAGQAGSVGTAGHAGTSGGTGGTGGGSGSGSGGGSTDGAAGGGGASAGCAGNTYLLCDDFEKGTVGDAPDTALWTITSADGATAKIDDHHVAHGNHAVHLAMPAGKSQVLMHETKTFPLPQGKDTIFGRVSFYVENALTFPTKHTNFFEASGKIDGTTDGNYRYGLNNGKLFANYNPSDAGKGSATAPPKGAWTCMEWEFGGDTNELHFWLDSQEITDVAVPSAGVNGMVWKAPKFDSLYIGWVTYETADMPAYDVWYDDVALDVTRIGCP